MAAPLSTKPLRIINVMAASLDGRIASEAHERDEIRQDQGFTTPEDRTHLESLLSSADAVILGSSSLKASGGAIEIAKKDGSMPLWVVLTNSGLPSGSAFYRQHHIPRWLVSSSPLPGVPPEVRQITYGDEPAAQTILKHLQDAGMERVLLFGGSQVNRLFYAADLVDELILTVCPILIGQSQAIPFVAPNLPHPKHLTLKASHIEGDSVFLTYIVRNP